MNIKTKCRDLLRHGLGDRVYYRTNNTIRMCRVLDIELIYNLKDDCVYYDYILKAIDRDHEYKDVSGDDVYTTLEDAKAFYKLNNSQVYGQIPDTIYNDLIKDCSKSITIDREGNLYANQKNVNTKLDLNCPNLIRERLFNEL